MEAEKDRMSIQVRAYLKRLGHACTAETDRSESIERLLDELSLKEARRRH